MLSGENSKELFSGENSKELLCGENSKELFFGFAVCLSIGQSMDGQGVIMDSTKIVLQIDAQNIKKIMINQRSNKALDTT